MAKTPNKVSTDIFKHVVKTKPTASKNTSWCEAWDILSVEWGFEGELSHTIKDKTVFNLYKNDALVEVYKLGEMFDYKIGDFNYNDIFKHVLNNIIKRRLYKKTKASNSSKKSADDAHVTSAKTRTKHK